jgi:hypothetical protein
MARRVVIVIDKKNLPEEIEMMYEGDTNSTQLLDEVIKKIIQTIPFHVDLTRN